MPSPTSVALRSRTRLRRALAGLIAVAVSAAGLVAVAAPAQAAAPTIVSLTFDDGNADQLNALPALRANGMKATFYITSGYVGASGYLTRSDLANLKAQGHEIGGHTATHPDLATTSVDEAKRQICTDRKTLTSWGFSVRSFAYPFASSTPAVEQAVKDCGYRSGRLLGDLRSRFGCDDCAYAETTPPPAPFATRALDQVDATWTLADLKQGVLNAEPRGGWVQYTFHNVCANACSELAVTPTVFGQFLSWLKGRQARGTIVRTVGDVIGGSARSVVDGPAVPAPTGSTNGIVNPSMETVGADGDPACWMRGGWGANAPAFSSGMPAHTGAVASGITMSGYSSGDAKLLPRFDLGQCSPTVTPGRTYSLRSWYTSSGVTQFAVYLRSATGSWSYWTSSPWLPAASGFTQAAWTTPAIPSGYTGISFALTIFGDGTLRTDDLALYDSAGAPALTADAATPTPAPATSPQARQAAPDPTGPVEVPNATESGAGE
jgi:peptidoglycan/xylan/chitin deacetylase (PgdA/CDA1 family)